MKPIESHDVKAMYHLFVTLFITFNTVYNISVVQCDSCYDSHPVSLSQKFPGRMFQIENSSEPLILDHMMKALLTEVYSSYWNIWIACAVLASITSPKMTICQNPENGKNTQYSPRYSPEHLTIFFLKNLPYNSRFRIT